jgi:hypothetical protein
MQEVSEELNIPIIVSQTSIKKSASYRTLRANPNLQTD